MVTATNGSSPPMSTATTSLPPPPLQPRIPRPPIRIIVLCDGTAQARDSVKSALSTTKHNANSPPPQTGDFFTNVALLAKCISSSSGISPTSPPTSPNPDSTTGVMPQLVFYQSGVGTGTGFLQNLFDQGTGFALGSKIEQAYGFIVDNYQPGDELFFFGFSRGAYTARCITGFINWCGVLSKVEMTHFAEIWAAYQKRDPDSVESEREAAKVLYAATLKWPSIESEQVATNMFLYALDHDGKYAKLTQSDKQELVKKRRDECSERRKGITIVPPQIKVVGVWDTVSALGFPGTFQDNVMIDFFDFYDPGLGSNIQFGFHALSLEEDRKDFLPTMWYQPSVASTPNAAPSGEIGVRGQHMRSKQLLKQCWFQGVHTDCGGGYQYHGLSDLTLIWMVSQLVDPHTLPDGSTTLRPLLNIDIALLATVLDRRREWGTQLPHRSRPTVNYQQPRTVCQRNPTTIGETVWATMAANGRTNETIHPSVVRGGRIDPDTHPAFADLRTYDRARLTQMWDEAKDWQSTLRPTEKLLYWGRRGPYPWIPGVGDAYLNPLLAPLMITGGWNIPELAKEDAMKVVISAAQEAVKASAMADVDEAEETPSGGQKADQGVDVDDQTADGWGELTSDTKTTAFAPAPSNALTTPGLLNLPTTPPPQQTYPLIPSKELGENPINPSTHPHMHTLWQTVYNLSSAPNALIADLCNMTLVTKANLRQTALQGWWWDLGDKMGGYSDDVKVQALTAGLGAKPKRKGRVLRRKGKVGEESEDGKDLD